MNHFDLHYSLTIFTNSSSMYHILRDARADNGTGSRSKSLALLDYCLSLRKLPLLTMFHCDFFAGPQEVS